MMAIRELEILLRLEDAERRGETPRARGGLGSRFRQALPQQMQFVLAGRLRTDPRQSRTPSSQYAQASQLCLTLQQDRCLRVQPTPTGPPATDLVKRPRAGPLAATAADLRPIRADRAPHRCFFAPAPPGVPTSESSLLRPDAGSSGALR
jgi:hypothetical protein